MEHVIWMRTIPHKLMYLNTRSLTGGIIYWRLVKFRVQHWGRTYRRVYSPSPPPVCSLLSVCSWRSDLSALCPDHLLPSLCHACALTMDSPSETLIQNTPLPSISCFSNREVKCTCPYIYSTNPEPDSVAITCTVSTAPVRAWPRSAKTANSAGRPTGKSSAEKFPSCYWMSWFGISIYQ